MRLRQKFFYAIVLIGSPVWVTILILMLCWDIACNFRGQVNAGYRIILKNKGIQ